MEQADLLIAATNTDEQNLLTCLIAKRAGAKHTIARVRSPEYVKEISLIQEDLGLSLTINPELACATEMARVLRFPSAVKIDTFTGGRVEILKHCLSPNSPLVGIRLSELSRFKASVLICAVERGKEVFIPNGSFQLAAGDRISIVAQPRDASLFSAESARPPHRSGRLCFWVGDASPTTWPHRWRILAQMSKSLSRTTSFAGTWLRRCPT